MRQICAAGGVLGSLLVYNMLVVPKMFLPNSSGGIDLGRSLGAGLAAALGVGIGHVVHRCIVKDKK